MIREIKKKFIILGNRMPFTPEIKSYFRQIEEKEWLYNNMKLEGTGLTRGQIETMAMGDVYLNVPIGDHVMADKISMLLEKLWFFESMKRSLDLSVVDEIHREISGDKNYKNYRKRNLVIQELGYTPPMPAAIPERMDSLARVFIEALDAEPVSEEVFEYMAAIHNKTAEIFPYGENDRLIARVTATYYMMIKGFPAVMLDMKEQEYNDMIGAYLKTGDLTECKEAFKRVIFNRLDLMIQLTPY